MQTIDQLSEEENLSYSQIRRRIKALGEVMDPHTGRNSDSKLIIDSDGTELIRRLEELREQGSTIEDAANSIKEDVLETSAKDRHSGDNPATVKELRERVEELKKDKEKLYQQLNEKDRQIQQLLPGKVERKSPVSRFFDWLF